MRIKRLGLVLLLLTFPSGISTAQKPELNPEDLPARVLRQDGKVILQSAIKTYSSSIEGRPEIVLLGNFHAGEEDYFRAIQTELNQADLVLFEAPGRPGHLSALRPSDKQRASRARAAGKYICAALALYAERNGGQYPASLDETVSEEMEKPNRAFLQRAIDDSGWGEAWSYQKTEDEFELKCLGADLAEGGKKVNKDLLYTQKSKIVEAFLNMLRQTDQSRQTEAMIRMQFVDQGAVLDYSASHFILSDVDHVMVKSMGIPNNFGPPDMVGDTPRPEPGTPEEDAEKNKLRRRFIDMNDPDKVPWMYGINPTGRNREMFNLMVVSRNDFVIDDLNWILKQEVKPDNVTVLYGAGHMREIETRLLGDLGYEFRKIKWLTVCEACED